MPADPLPVVGGPPKENYLQVLPAGSFIHIDDFKDPEELSKFLLDLDQDQVKYEEYFNWKKDDDNVYFQVLRKATGICDMFQKLIDGQLDETRSTDIYQAYLESYETCKVKIWSFIFLTSRSIRWEKWSSKIQ